MSEMTPDTRKLSEYFEDGDRLWKYARSDASDYLDDFLNLPRRCQEVFFWYMLLFEGTDPRFRKPYGAEIAFYNFNQAVALSFAWQPINQCESPIEKIFLMAFEIVYSSLAPVDDICFQLEPQVEIECNGKNYRVDFLADSTEECFHKYLVTERDIKLIIECDGHDYHNKTKEQVAHDNERDLNLKMAGYDVIHFSGSQIYQNPFECAEKAYSYFINALGEIKAIKPEATDGDL